MDVFEAIFTTRAMRRLDPERTVGEADLWRVLEASGKGPSGGNRQPLRWVVVQDAEQKARLGEIYRQAFRDYEAGIPGDAEADEQVRRNMDSARHLADHLEQAPVILLACARRVGYTEAAVFPCVWNLCLAARALGLGTTLTTMHRLREDDVREALGIPDEVEVFALIPLGYPRGRWGEAPRRPVEETVYWDAWGEQRIREAS